jgi:transcriptional regulator with XRE-family HTH domain
MKNFKLKARAIEKFGTQIRFAEAVQISELRLSRLIHGRSQPTAEEKRIISEQLGVPELEIFPKN